MPERLRLRTSPWRLLPGVLILPLFITQLALTGAPGALVAALALFLVLIGVASVAWFGITLTPDAAVVHGFGRRRVPWSEVQAVTVERYVIELRIVLWTARDKVPLRAPMTTFALGEQAVLRAYHQVGQWWLAHRGADWRPAHLPNQYVAPPFRADGS